MISFEPLRIILVKRNIKKMEFLELCKISAATGAKLWKDEYVSLDIVDRICSYLGVQPGEVMDYRSDRND